MRRLAPIFLFFACTGEQTEQEPVCGDGICNAAEDCSTCDDCGACVRPGLTPGWLRVGHGTIKFRPHEPLPLETAVRVEAARNEFEPYQIVVDGGPGGRTIHAVTPGPLNGPGTIPATASRPHAVRLFDIPSASNLEGAEGPWPDPLVPAVDPYFGEQRTAFPLWVPPGERRAIWVDVHVPRTAVAGEYRGEVALETTSGPVRVPVSLRVFGFELPSTASLRTAFGLNWNDACEAHHGSYEACGADAGIEHFNTLYARAALDHRVSLASLVYTWPRDDDWTHFDDTYGPLLDGTAETQLEGAQLTTLQSVTAGLAPEKITEVTRSRLAHIREMGWSAQPFHYTCDEPPDGCAWDQIRERAAPVREAGMPTLVTTDLARAFDHSVAESVDILAPLMNWVHPEGRFGDGPEYAAWRAEKSGRQFWWYQSCISHGCGSGCDTTPGEDYTGWPSYVIDASAIQARAMPWISYQYGVDAELYFATTYSLTDAWTDQCAFSGSGDGTLFYPGTPDRVGGTHDIPIMSVRWKMIREGLEDYEYLHRLRELGEGEWAHARSRDLFPAHNSVTSAPPERLYEIRRELAERIEALTQE